MRLYPDLPARRLRTIVRDLLVVVLLVCFALIGLWAHDVIDKVSVLGEGVRRVGEEVPFVGDPVEDLGPPRRGARARGRQPPRTPLLRLPFAAAAHALRPAPAGPDPDDHGRFARARRRRRATRGDARGVLAAVRDAARVHGGPARRSERGAVRRAAYGRVRRGRAPALVYRLSVSAAPTVSNTSPATRIQVSPIFSRPNSPKRSITAAINRFPAVMIPTVAAVPIRGAANVMPTTITAPIAAADQSQGGSLAASAYPERLWRATTRSVAAIDAVRSVANAKASSVPTRSPKRPINAAWTAPASPPATLNATAATVALLMARPEAHPHDVAAQAVTAAGLTRRSGRTRTDCPQCPCSARTSRRGGSAACRRPPRRAPALSRDPRRCPQSRSRRQAPACRPPA